MNIVLIGFMGTGKSAVGKLVAGRLGYSFYDTDEMIEKEMGLTIADIFARDGETHFREMEGRTVKLVSLLDKAVIATGGGVPLREENMRELSRNGVVVHLSAQPQTVLERVKKSLPTRPLLKGHDPLGTIQGLLERRRPAYGRARHTVATDGLTVEQVAERVMGLLPKEAAG